MGLSCLVKRPRIQGLDSLTGQHNKLTPAQGNGAALPLRNIRNNQVGGSPDLTADRAEIPIVFGERQWIPSLLSHWFF